MELNRTTKAYGAYVDDTFVGVLLAEMLSQLIKSDLCENI